MRFGKGGYGNDQALSSVGLESMYRVDDATGALVLNAILLRVQRGTLTAEQAKEALDTLGLTAERFRRTGVGSEQGSPEVGGRGDVRVGASGG